jgi:serine/threonine protein kinase
VLYTYDRCPQHPEEFEVRFLLTHFGLFRPIDNEEDDVTREGFGTGGYGAAEVFDGKYGKKSDMFSIGCVMFEVASMGLQRAFKEDYEIRRYKDDYPRFALRELKSRWYSGLDNLTLKSFNRWIRECLDLDPDRRPEAAELKKRLERKFNEAYEV